MENQNSMLAINNPEYLHLCFNLDNNKYALNSKYVLEITSLPLLNEPQRLSEYVVGILNYNDLFINVIDIRKILNLPIRKYELSNKVVVLKGEESLFAIIVDEITDFFTAEPIKMQRVMGDSSNNITKNFYKLQEDVVNLIDVFEVETVMKKTQSMENSINYSELFPSDANSVCILNKRKNEIAQIPNMSLDMGVYGKDQYIVFMVGGHLYCIYSLFVRELITLKNYSLVSIPYTPDFIMGVVNLKGDFYTVVNLKKFVGFSDDEAEIGKDGKVIVIQSNELKLALYVDAIVDIENIAPSSIVVKNDKKLDDIYIKAEAYIENKVYNVLNIDKLINDERLYIGSS